MTRAELIERCDHWHDEAKRALELAEAARDRGDHELSSLLASLASACIRLSDEYLQRARA